jgi:hypothetical protein
LHGGITSPLSLGSRRGEGTRDFGVIENRREGGEVAGWDGEEGVAQRLAGPDARLGVVLQHLQHELLEEQVLGVARVELVAHRISQRPWLHTDTEVGRERQKSDL